VNRGILKSFIFVLQLTVIMALVGVVGVAVFTFVCWSYLRGISGAYETLLRHKSKFLIGCVLVGGVPAGLSGLLGGIQYATALNRVKALEKRDKKLVNEDHRGVGNP
jgi:hypothetical protein